jgi:glycerophosphoryl diester phosphodiesterase
MKYIFLIIGFFMTVAAGAQNASLQEYTGKYTFPSGNGLSEALVEIKEDKLFISSERGAASLTRQQEDTFAVDEYGGQIIFVRKEKSVSGIKVDIPAANLDVEGEKAAGGNTATAAKVDLNGRQPFVPKPGIDLQAHQGGCGRWPCNTLTAFMNAVKMGVNTLEMDCVISKDSMVLLSHDHFLDYSLPNTNIFTLPYDSIRKFDVGTKPNPYFQQQQKVAAYKPLLSEVIDAVEQYVKKNNLKPVHYNIEIKSLRGDNVYHPAPDVFTDLVVKVIRDKHIEDKVMIQSFDVRALQYLHQHYPGLQVSYLVNSKNGLQENIDRLGFVPHIYSPEYKAVTAELVQQVHQAGMALIPWTIDKQEDLQQIIGLGVDGVITNYPDLALKLIKAKK